jgi:hypothetical protein
MHYHEDDYRDIDEKLDIINTTSTMTTQDLVDAYTYAWMYTSLHTAGYTEIYSKYARYKMSIPYRKFYDHLWSKIWKDDFFSTHLQDLEHRVHTYLTTGKMVSGTKSTNLGTLHSIFWLYENRHAMYKSLRSIVSDIMALPHGLVQMQENFVIDPMVKYPLEITVPFDIHTWEDRTSTYNIMPKMKLSQNFDFYRYRRNSLHKNNIIALTQHNIDRTLSGSPS